MQKRETLKLVSRFLSYTAGQTLIRPKIRIPIVVFSLGFLTPVDSFQGKADHYGFFLFISRFLRIP